jgi:hypothetical protein
MSTKYQNTPNYAWTGSDYILWKQRKEKEMIPGDESICDCGQPFSPEGVCISCNPPEEAEEPVLEREEGDPNPLDFDAEESGGWDCDMNDEDEAVEEEFDESY